MLYEYFYFHEWLPNGPPGSVGTFVLTAVALEISTGAESVKLICPLQMKSLVLENKQRPKNASKRNVQVSTNCQLSPIMYTTFIGNSVRSVQTQKSNRRQVGDSHFETGKLRSVSECGGVQCLQ